MSSAAVSGIRKAKWASPSMLNMPCCSRKANVVKALWYRGRLTRVLKPGGDFVILNFSYGEDESADESTVRKLAGRHSFKTIAAGERPFSLWDGVAFHLRKKSAER